MRNYQQGGNRPFLTWYTVTTPSMFPTIAVDNLILNRRVNSETNIRVNDIITFISTNPQNKGATVTHRVIEIKVEFDKYSFITAGDNNFASDPEPVYFDDILGKMLLTISPRIARIILIITIVIIFLLNIITLKKDALKCSNSISMC